MEHSDIEAGGNNSTKTKKVVHPGPYAKPSWKFLDGPPRRNAEAAKLFYAWAISHSSDDTRYFPFFSFILLHPFGIEHLSPCTSHHFSAWIISETPKTISLTGNEIIEQLRPGGMLKPDIIDALTRTFAQKEYRRNVNGPTTAWRHFLETDFSVINNSHILLLFFSFLYLKLNSFTIHLSARAVLFF